MSPPTPAPVVSGNCETLRPLVSQYNWSVATALAIIQAESGCHGANHNYSDATGDDSWGLFQINLYGDLKYGRPSGEWLSNPANNIEYAYQMYQKSGWTPWSTYKTGRYLNFIGA